VRTRLRHFFSGRHARLLYDEGLGWMVLVRGEVIDGDEALESPVPRIGRLPRQAAFRNPDHSGLPPEEVSFIWPQRGSDKGGV
jgi:hypothetical protein